MLSTRQSVWKLENLRVWSCFYGSIRILDLHSLCVRRMLMPFDLNLGKKVLCNLTVHNCSPKLVNVLCNPRWMEIIEVSVATSCRSYSTSGDCVRFIFKYNPAVKVACHYWTSTVWYHWSKKKVVWKGCNSPWHCFPFCCTTSDGMLEYSPARLLCYKAYLALKTDW